MGWSRFRPVRLVHTSDWHLGHELYGFERGPEHDAFLDWLASKVDELRADGLIVAGDIYDTVNPPIPAQQRLYRFLSRVLTADPFLEIVIVGGNHDSAARLELPRELLNDGRVHLFGAVPRVSGRPAPGRTVVELHDRSGIPRAMCGAVPYLRPGDLPVSAKGDEAVGLLYREVIDSVSGQARDLPLVLTGHLHVTGGVVSELSERRVLIGGQEAVSSTIFPSNVAYVALGHLHKPQAIAGLTQIRYSGSPLPMSVAEKDYEHSVVVVDIGTDGVVHTDLLRTPRPVAFYRVPAVGAAPLDQVESELLRLDLEDPGVNSRPFIEVAVALDSAQPDLKERIEAALDGKPLRLTRIVRQTAGQRGALADGVRDMLTLGELEPIDVFGQRHRAEYGTDPPPDLSKAFDDVLAGVLAAGPEPGGSA